MAGFAAACFQRGTDFVQVPTTLLAQVDSSVGGKTAINHPLGKNMIGAFHQPQLVLVDLECLRTLPPRELRAGLAEVVKYGAILDPAFFSWIEAHADDLLAGDLSALAWAVKRSCELKAEVVAEDEREGGRRAILNFGHTFGHAIEAGLGYGTWLHGEAVGCGMVLAARLSVALGALEASEADRLTQLIARLGLPTQAPDWAPHDFIELMRGDKKAQAGQIRYIVLSSLGHAEVKAVQDELVTKVLAAGPRLTPAAAN